MKLRKGHAAICVAAAFAGGAVFAAIGLGEKSGDVRASLDRDTEGVVSVREVKAPSAGAPASALAQTAKKKKGVRIRYFEETAATTIADQEERIATLPCPAKTKAINGYAISFDTAVLVVNARSFCSELICATRTFCLRTSPSVPGRSI